MVLSDILKFPLPRLKILLLVIGCFILFKASGNYLIPCKNLALRTIMVKMGAKTKLHPRSLEFSNVFFHVFMYFEDSCQLDT